MKSAVLHGSMLLSLLLATPAGAQPAKKAVKNPTVLLSTSKGDITVELFAAEAPKTVANFLEYVKSGHYDGTVFHRVIDNFMVQGGGMELAKGEMKEKATRPSIQNEADNGKKNLRGTLAMARTNDPHSASSQFFINVKDNAFLDHKSKDARGWGYAVFGQVVKGMEVVDAIKSVKTGRSGMHSDVPVEPVLVKKAKAL